MSKKPSKSSKRRKIVARKPVRTAPVLSRGRRIAALPAMLDALPAHIALLDDAGVIIAVNAAWRRFAADNALAGSDCGVGADYLAVCDRAGGPFSQEARAAAAGIRRVLHERKAGFALDYPCHAPGAARWFRLMATPSPDEKGVVVMHLDITELKLAEQKLRENDGSLRQLAAQLDEERNRLVQAQAVAKVGSWETDLTTLEIKWSLETHRIFETDPESFRPTHAAFLQRVHPDDRRLVDDAFVRSARRPEPQVLAHRLLLPDGRIKFVEERWQVVFDEKSRPLRAIGTCQDITQRRVGEEQARRLAERLSTTLESITDAFLIIDRNWCFTYLNGRAEQLLQRRGSELLGRDIWQEFPAAAGSTFEREYRRALAENVTVGFEAYYPQPLDIWFEVRAYPSDEGLAVYFRDITTARQAHEALRLSEQRVREMAENIGMVFFNFDPVNNRLLYVNAAYERIWGRSLGSVYADPQSYLEGVHPEDRPAAEAAYRRHLAGEEVYTDFRVVRADGSVRWVREHAVPVKDAAGHVERVVGTMRDITEGKLAEQETRHNNEVLAGIVDALQEISALDRPLPELMRLMAEWAQKLTGADGGVVEMIEADEMVYRAVTGTAVGRLGLRFPQQASLTGRVVASGTALLSDDTETDDRVNRAACRRAGVRSMVVAPLRDGPLIIGALKVTSSRPQAFTVRDVNNLQILVESLGAVIQRQHAAEGLRASEERFRLLAKATNDAVWDWNLLTDAIWWSEGFETLFGHHREALPTSSKSWTDLIHPDDAARVLDGVRAVIDGTGIEWTEEYRFRCQDGSYLHVLDRGHVLRDAAGRAVRMIGGMTDLSERKRTEEKLREQAALLDKATDAILVRDLDHRILFWNRAAARLYGWTAAEALGRSVHDLLYGVSSAFHDACKAVMAHGEWQGEIEQTAKDGRTLTVEGHWTLVRDAQGGPKSVLAINTDITARKKLERQYLRAQRMESIGTLAGGIAHDLNNLLSPIVMGAGLLQRYELPESGREVLRNIEGSARRGAELVKQVLSFARGVEGERVPLELGHLFREIRGIVKNTFPKNIIFESEIGADLWLVAGDATQLNQVFVNLCVNARDAMPDGGRLTLVAANREIDAQYAATDRSVPAGRYVLIELTDTGVGMTQEVMDRIFEPFFTTKDLGKGTGLGLSTAIGIVRSHGGTVTVRSEPGRGSTFRVWLPAHADQAVPAPATAQPVLIPGNNEQVLLVDDEAPVLAITRQTLEAFGYRVMTAADGAQAVGLYAIQQQDIAVVLTDLMMPVMDGPMLIASLLRINPQVRIIAASGLNTSDYMTRAVGLGVQHFLNKPYTAEALLTMMHKVLAEQPPLRRGAPPA